MEERSKAVGGEKEGRGREKWRSPVWLTSLCTLGGEGAESIYIYISSPRQTSLFHLGRWTQAAIIQVYWTKSISHIRVCSDEGLHVFLVFAAQSVSYGPWQCQHGKQPCARSINERLAGARNNSAETTIPHTKVDTATCKSTGFVFT